jgi:hypothetical protein
MLSLGIMPFETNWSGVKWEDFSLEWFNLPTTAREADI